jgi:hypothetical protein
MWSVAFLLASLQLCALVRAGRFSDTLAMTGDVEKDFTLGAPDYKLRKGVIKINDAALTGGQTPVESPDVGLPPGPAWSGRLSGWDIKNIYVQLDFDSGAFHFGINCFGVCGDADGNGDANGGVGRADSGRRHGQSGLCSLESVAIGLDLGGPGATLKGDGVMDFVFGYPSGAADGSERFPCGVRFDISCFGLYFYQEGKADQPGQRFVWTTDPYRTFSANLLPSLQASVVDNNSKPSLARPDLEWTINNFNGELRFGFYCLTTRVLRLRVALRTAAGFDAVDLNASFRGRSTLSRLLARFRTTASAKTLCRTTRPS